MTLAIWAVIFSWICKRLAKTWTTRASFEIPTTRPLGAGIQAAEAVYKLGAAAVGNVGDPGLADDRCHVMLAVAFEADGAERNHLVVALDLLEGLGQDFRGVHRVAREILLVGLDDTLWRLDQPIARGILAGPAENRAHRLFGFLLARLALLGGSIGCGFGSGVVVVAWGAAHIVFPLSWLPQLLVRLRFSCREVSEG